MKPLVSCILVTRDRPAFVARALQYFRHQSYHPAELIVVDDGDCPVESLCEDQDHVTYLRLNQRTSTGSKLNLGIQAARGNILQKIDDDDYYAPSFLEMAVDHLTREADARALVCWCCFAVWIAGQPELYHSGHGWHAGGTFCFYREMWERVPFQDRFSGSDTAFLRDHQPRLIRVCAPEQYMLVRHGRNTWQQIRGAEGDKPVESYFRQRSPFPRSMESLVGSEYATFYNSLLSSDSGSIR